MSKEREIVSSYNGNKDSAFVVDLTRSFDLSCVKDSFNSNANCNWYFLCSNGHKISLGGKSDKNNRLSSDIALSDGLKSYLDGRESDAVKLFKVATEYGSIDAINLIGVCYSNAIGVIEDWGEAVEWFKKAARYGSIPAMANLAYCYYHEKGVKQDMGKVEKYYKKIAMSGDLGGIFSLGCFYYRRGNLMKGIELLELAEEQGFKAAGRALGYIDMIEDGVDLHALLSMLGVSDIDLESLFLPKYYVVEN